MPKVVPSAQKMLGEGHLRVEIEVKTSVPTIAARGPAAPSAAGTSGFDIGHAVAVVRHVVGSYEGRYWSFCVLPCL